MLIKSYLPYFVRTNMLAWLHSGLIKNCRPWFEFRISYTLFSETSRLEADMLVLLSKTPTSVIVTEGKTDNCNNE